MTFHPILSFLSQRAQREVTVTPGDDLGVALAASYDSGAGEGGAEVVSHVDGRLYITNGAEDRIDVVEAASGARLTSLDLSAVPGYAGITSVSASATGIAVAVEIDADVSPKGVVAFFAPDGTFQGTVEVGNLPDMVTHSADGSRVFVANEGEPADGADPMGSISVIDVATRTAQTFDFSQFDAQVDALREAGVRIFPGSLPSTDFEPEYIAEADGKLIVTLQEANAVAIFDLDAMRFDAILPLGTLDHATSPLDASDRDGAIDIRTYEALAGLRMPDAVAAAQIGGATYVLTANEGDDRGDAFVFDADDGAYDGDDRGDAARVGDILDGMDTGNPVQFRDGALVRDVTFDAALYSYLQGPEGAGLDRLTVSVIDGDTDGDGDIDVLHSYGTRSFTIFDLSGNVVFDSGADFERIIAENRVPNAFNNDDFPSGDPTLIDENRSDNKGPEPEAIEIGEVGGRTLAFIGLERDSGIMIYDISDPANASFVDYIDGAALGNFGPEVITFIPAQDSATGLAQIAVSYEVSGTTAVYDLEFGAGFSGTRGRDDIAGTLGDDSIRGDAGRDTIAGHDGDDMIDAGRGRDLVLGGPGDDRIMGGAGRDTIEGGTGDDVLGGGHGRDVFVFALGDGADRIQDFGRGDLIDMTATGLAFDDLTVTASGPGQVVVDYGDAGDRIEITLAQGGADLGEDAFIF